VLDQLALDVRRELLDLFEEVLLPLSLCLLFCFPSFLLLFF
jgi:hypothetical protein